jgi:hypothetical protein
VRKDIKNLHLGVYQPHGRVRVAPPLVITDDAVRLVVIDKLGPVNTRIHISLQINRLCVLLNF